VATRRRGFTLIELLVVIAIIAILAGMLFPVFARARESARKIQCLSNVKNIALAVQMYLTDYDRLWPKEHRSDVMNWFNDKGGKTCCCRPLAANPYLQKPVILDEYVKNRDVWRCPSARYVKNFAINPGYGIGDWFNYLLKAKDGGACRISYCSDTFPPGWGGSITDSAVQDQCGGPDTSGFDMSIGVIRFQEDLKTGQMQDPAKFAVVFDAGPNAAGVDRTSWVAYPDTCRIDSVACNSSCGADWVNCSWTQTCGALKGDPRWATDPQYRKVNAKSRHLGGSNIGYADGHAAWMASEQILFGGVNGSGYAANSNNPALNDLSVCIVPIQK